MSEDERRIYILFRCGCAMRVHSYAQSHCSMFVSRYYLTLLLLLPFHSIVWWCGHHTWNQLNGWDLDMCCDLHACSTCLLRICVCVWNTHANSMCSNECVIRRSFGRPHRDAHTFISQFCVWSARQNTCFFACSSINHYGKCWFSILH